MKQIPILRSDSAGFSIYTGVSLLFCAVMYVIGHDLSILEETKGEIRRAALIAAKSAATEIQLSKTEREELARKTFRSIFVRHYTKSIHVVINKNSVEVMPSVNVPLSLISIMGTSPKLVEVRAVVEN